MNIFRVSLLPARPAPSFAALTMATAISLFACSPPTVSGEDNQKPLSASIGKTWRVEFVVRQQPPNKGAFGVALDENGDLYRAEWEQERVTRDSKKTWRKMRRIESADAKHLLAVALTAAESITLEGIKSAEAFDLPVAELSILSGGRTIRVERRLWDSEIDAESWALMNAFPAAVRKVPLDNHEPDSQGRQTKLITRPRRGWRIEMTVVEPVADDGPRRKREISVDDGGTGSSRSMLFTGAGQPQEISRTAVLLTPDQAGLILKAAAHAIEEFNFGSREQPEVPASSAHVAYDLAVTSSIRSIAITDARVQKGKLAASAIGPVLRLLREDKIAIGELLGEE
jgi:hypothetical protein